MARGDDLILKVTADTSAVAAGLKPLTNALGVVETDATHAEAALKELDALDVTPTVKVSVRDEAIAKARADIDRLRDEIAQGVSMGLDTKEAERRVSSLEASIRRLVDKPEKVNVDVEVDKEAMADALEGVDSLREGALGLGEAVGAANGSLTGFAQIGREMVPALADLNQTMVALRLRNEAAGLSFGRLGRSVSAVTGVMAGPWGLAIAAGVGLLTAFAAKQDAASEATDNFTDSIDLQAGAMDKANRAAAAKRLEDEGILEVAERLGLSTEDMVSAVLGNVEAYRRVSVALGTYSMGLQENERVSGAWASQVEDADTKFSRLFKMFEEAKPGSDRMVRAIGDVSKETDDAAFSFDRLSDGVSHNAELWQDYDKQVGEAQKAVDDIIKSLDILNGRFVTSREANIKYEKSIDDVNKAIEDNGKAVTKNKRAFDTATEAGRANEEAFIDAAEALDTLTRTRLDDAKGSDVATAKVLDNYGKQRASLIETARKMGLSQDAAEDYVDSLLETPDELSTHIGLTGYKDAKDKVNDLTKERDAVVNVKLNVDKYELERLRRRLAEGVGGPGDPVAGATGRGVSPSVFLSPRLYLDSRPIRAALRGDVESVVSSTVAATSHRGRL